MKTMAKIILAVFVTVVLGFGSASAAQLVIGSKLEPSSIDPHYHNLGPNNAIARHIFDRLVDTNEKQQLGPGLAVSWKAINDTTWEFKLRQDVKFHDGTPFTADDVMFTFERAPNVEASPSSFALYTKGKMLKKIDDYTVHFITEKPYPLMPNDVVRAPKPAIIIPAKPQSGLARTNSVNGCRAIDWCSTRIPPTGASRPSSTGWCSSPSRKIRHASQRCWPATSI
jgi:ABC-type transport system substrate-binding protein